MQIEKPFIQKAALTVVGVIILYLGYHYIVSDKNLNDAIKNLNDAKLELDTARQEVDKAGASVNLIRNDMQTFSGSISHIDSSVNAIDTKTHFNEVKFNIAKANAQKDLQRILDSLNKIRDSIPFITPKYNPENH